MSLFCIIGHDAMNSNSKRVDLLEKHLEYLRALNQKGCLLAAGPLLKSEAADAIACGSMLLVDFESQEAARNWFANDPYNQAGVYQTVQVYPYRDGLPYC